MQQATEGRSGRRLRDALISFGLELWQVSSERPRLALARVMDRRRGRGSEHIPIVSIPIATYDRIDILASRTIPSILAQTWSSIEVIIVADGTPDDLLEPLSRIVDPRVRVHRLRHRTRYPRAPLERWMVAGCRPRNVGARLSHGAWILWMSDDDVLMPDAVEKLIAAAEQSGPATESVFGSYISGTAEPHVITAESGREVIGFPATGPPAWLIRRRLRLFRWNKQSWRRRTERPCDYDLFRRMHRAGVRFATTEHVVASQPDVSGTDLPGRRGALRAAGLDV